MVATPTCRTTVAHDLQRLLARMQSTRIWHAAAGWIKPARLVQACLSQPGIRFVGEATVQSIERDRRRLAGPRPDRRAVGTGAQLVLACAGDATRLINQRHCKQASGGARLSALAAVDGQVSWAAHAPGDAHVVPAVRGQRMRAA